MHSKNVTSQTKQMKKRDTETDKYHWRHGNDKKSGTSPSSRDTGKSLLCAIEKLTGARSALARTPHQQHHVKTHCESSNVIQNATPDAMDTTMHHQTNEMDAG